jgi:hypothetical protein
VGDLDDLIERVEKATGANFALEREVFEAFTLPTITEWFGQPVVGWFRQGHAYGFNTADGYSHFGCLKPPPVTASLDAALALCERCLPGWEFSLEVERPADGPAVWRVEMGDPLRGWTAEAPTPALAVVAALLRALKEKQA